MDCITGIVVDLVGTNLWPASACGIEAKRFCSNFAFSRGRHFDHFPTRGLTDVSKIVGAFLLIMGLLRSSSVLKNNLDLLITKHPKAIFLSTGLIHGLSNMGGGLLSFLMASIHKNKLNIRTNIAFVYCCFCFLQLILLSLFKAEPVNLDCLVFPAFSLLIFLLLNRFLMDLINENEFQHAISLIIIIYGAASLIG